MLMTPKVGNLIELSGYRITGRQKVHADAIQRRDLCQQKIQQLSADLKVARHDAKLAAKQLAWVEFEDDVQRIMESEAKAASLVS